MRFFAAFRIASDRRHDLVSLEHMLHALMDDPQAKDILLRCRVDLAELKADLEEVLEKAFTPVPGRKAVKPESTLGFDRVVERAVVHAASSSAQQVESGALLVFLLQEEDSHAAYFLRKQGVDRLTLLRAVSHGTPQPRFGQEVQLDKIAEKLNTCLQDECEVCTQDAVDAKITSVCKTVV